MKIVSQWLQFFKEVHLEMAKVIWPTMPEFIGATVIVLILMTAFSIYLGVIDTLFALAAKNIFVHNNFFGL